MFTKPVVFIVGAGASAELNLPVGSALRDRLADDLAFNRTNTADSRSGAGRLFSAMKRVIENERLNKLHDAGRLLAPVMKTHGSVDEALHYFSENEAAVEVGKLAIAARILFAERATELLPKDDDIESVRRFSLQTSGWLYHFLSMAMRGTKRGDSERLFENVTIICFNYDRTIEQFLFHGLTRHGALNAGEAIAAIAKLRILRPYGAIGALPWQSADRANGIPFGGDQHHVCERLVDAAANIRTFTEQVQR